ncbi:MAG: DUF1800 family protein [Blastocatellia bacterium]
MEQRFRLCVVVALALLLAHSFALPFAAQQKIPFDESRIVDDLTRALDLQPEQVARLNDLLDARRPRIEAILREMSQLVPESPEFNQLRGQMERERRAMVEELLPALGPEQQARLRGLMGSPPAMAAPTRPAPMPASPVQPLKPNLPGGYWGAEEKLIPIPRENLGRGRRPNDSSLSEEQRILHLLNRAGFGPRPGDVERVRRMGFDRYLEQQLHPEDLPDEFLARPLNSLNTLQMTTVEIVQNFAPPPPPRPAPTPTPAPIPTPAPGLEPGSPRMEGAAPGQMAVSPPVPQMTQPPRPPQRDGGQPLRELQQAKLLRAVFSERQLQEVMVDFWYNHFNVWANKDSVRWMVTSHERDVIRPHALGRFKELLVATAQSPAMLYYLDNFLSQVEPPVRPAPKDAEGAPVPQRRPGLNENYARELMELHTLGVNGGYTQQDVIEVARCFTGWTINQQPAAMFVFRPRIHDKGEKIVLGKRIAAGGGIEDGLRVLEILAKHPSTARFLARKLAQRFVADDPPPSLVDRAAETFRGTDGDIREVVRTILTSPEFSSPGSYRTKVKSPFELAASALRATGASADGSAPLIQAVARMGAPLYLCQPPTGYSENSSEWMSSALLLERMNFALALAGNRINGSRVDPSRFVDPDALDDPRRLVDQLAAVLIHSDLSPDTRENLLRVLKETRTRDASSKSDPKNARKNLEQTLIGIAALTLGSREFQMR